jgi:hypothetical protein
MRSKSMHYLLCHGQTLLHLDHHVEVCSLSENKEYPLPKIDINHGKSWSKKLFTLYILRKQKCYSLQTYNEKFTKQGEVIQTPK